MRVVESTTRVVVVATTRATITMIGVQSQLVRPAASRPNITPATIPEFLIRLVPDYPDEMEY